MIEDILRDVKAILAKPPEIENCETCEVDEQPDPEAECEACWERAMQQGRTVGINPLTSQILQIRNFIKIGYRFDPEDLTYWQWEALAAVDQTIEEHKAKQLENIRGKK